jgi:hypothetical protein
MDFTKRKKKRDDGVVFEKISNSVEYKNDISTIRRGWPPFSNFHQS